MPRVSFPQVLQRFVACPPVDVDGETLAMASTSGRVWIGEGGGEQWQELDANLPPACCVRWSQP